MRGKVICWGEMNEGKPVEELAEFMVYCCAERKNKEASVAWKLIAVNFDPRAVGGVVIASAAR